VVEQAAFNRSVVGSIPTRPTAGPPGKIFIQKNPKIFLAQNRKHGILLIVGSASQSDRFLAAMRIFPKNSRKGYYFSMDRK
jgi:hypothetical protein